MAASRQSPAHTAETAAMRAFDLAFQRAAGLTARGRGRVLSYIAARLADEQAEAQAAGGQLDGGNSDVTLNGGGAGYHPSANTAAGGGSSPGGGGGAG
jgi:hypothetical protein